MNMNRDNCPMLHKENGNCLPIGGFCFSVSDIVCRALHGAYFRGKCDATRKCKEMLKGETENAESV